jgi:hypothetical protein
VEKLTINLLSVVGKGENSKSLSFEERDLERGFPDTVKSQVSQQIRDF